VTKQNAEMDKPVLIVVDGPLRGQQWVLDVDEMVIGRDAHCEIVIPERSVSREHVRVYRENNRVYIEDLGSKNGTHLNGVRVEGPRELQEGDEIQIALSVKIRFVGAESTVPLTIDEKEPDIEGLQLDRHTRQVMIRGEVLDPQLSLFQYRLIELLYTSGGGVCTRDDVVRAVWPDAVEEGVSEQAIDALVRRLRDRLSEVDPDHQYIVTVRGHGFRMVQSGASGDTWN